MSLVQYQIPGYGPFKKKNLCSNTKDSLKTRSKFFGRCVSEIRTAATAVSLPSRNADITFDMIYNPHGTLTGIVMVIDYDDDLKIFSVSRNWEFVSRYALQITPRICNMNVTLLLLTLISFHTLHTMICKYQFPYLFWWRRVRTHTHTHLRTHTHRHTCVHTHTLAYTPTYANLVPSRLPPFTVTVCFCHL